MELKNSVRTLENVPLGRLEPFQHGMKTLSEANYLKLRREIEETGFSFAVHVWENLGKMYVLDGHQRIECLRRMYEGKTDPLVPVVKVAAKDFTEAKRKVLAAASNYGEFNLHGVAEMLKDAKMDPIQAAAHFRLPEIDVSVLMEKKEKQPGPGSKELGAPELAHKCPKCGFEFDDPR